MNLLNMPNTEFRRPNPLDSDTIMDATARLLAPRRSLLSTILPKGGEKKQPEQKKPRAQKKPARPEQPGAKKAQKPAKAKQEPPKKAAPAPAKKKGASKPQRRDRRMPPEPPRKNQPKDSTEQASLMKPYYLDIGR